jgi:hypothetical protein
VSAAPLHPGRTITDADWAAMFKAHRARGHFHGSSMLRHIRTRVVGITPRQATAMSERRKLVPPSGAPA